MLKKISEKERAVSLRKDGFSLREISEELNISKSTASLWLRNINLSEKAMSRVENLRKNGRKNAINTIRKKKTRENKEIENRVKNYFSQINFSGKYSKISCALLYWCEGGKFDNAVTFMNSDPELIRYFLYVFRRSFKLDEKKFKALMHLHKYHDEKKQLRFWSEKTGIPASQFFKTYAKKNTGKSKKENYPGCISVRYYDKKIFKELVLIYKRLYNKNAGLV